jgi:hypothetical protein
MISSIFPVFFSFYIGAWCDLFGRKLCIFLYLGAKLIGQAILIVLAYNLEWPKEWFLLTLLPTSLLGKMIVQK